MAWPPKVTSGLAEAERLAAAIRSWVATMSMPVISSVRVLDLDPAVDLDEVEASIAVDEELEVPRFLVPGGDDGPDGALGELEARGRGRAGVGASSMSFRWRRWTEQSRSPRWDALAIGSTTT